jgi:monovalent cation/hydrogen antiporter
MPAVWFALVCLIPIGAALANRSPIPDAVIWALLGFAVAFIPGVPAFHLGPKIALFLVLPPLVYASAVQLPWPEFRDNLRPIALLAVGLVIATTAAVAALAHWVVGLPWPASFVLGAVVSPTDPVAASSVAGRSGLPRRPAAILEGEGLVNDGAALSLFRIALAASVGGGFSLSAGLFRLVAIFVGEPLYGWLLGRAIAALRERISDARIELTVSLLTPFAAYLVPEHFGGSGILATVAVGMYIGERNPTLVPAGTRLHATSFWQTIVFFLNAFLFLSAGMQLRQVFGAEHGGLVVLKWGLTIGAAVAVVRLAWCAVSWYGFRALKSALGRGVGGKSAKGMLVIAWSGMRGPISLAAVLSIPASVGVAGFPHFQLVVFLTSAVIMMTLVVQGAALPGLIHVLGISRAAAAEQEELRRQEMLGEREAAGAALQCLSELQARGRVPSQAAERLRRHYQDVASQGDGVPAGQLDAEVRGELLSAERSRILQLRNEGRISDHALERLQRTLDLRESLLD